LIGVDRITEADSEPAYNAGRGHGEIQSWHLARANRELGADFDLSAFRHAPLTTKPCRIEMHLVQ